jgi:uncharacterized membrane protein
MPQTAAARARTGARWMAGQHDRDHMSTMPPESAPPATESVKSKSGPLRRLYGFLKTTVLGGLIFLAPLVVIVLLGAKAIELLRRLARPVADRLPLDTFMGVLAADVAVIALLIVVCFFAGLLAQLSFANSFIKRAETGMLWGIPGYGFIKGLTDSLDKRAATASMRPAIVRFDDYSQLGFEVDALADGRKVVYMPGAPDPRAGTVVVVTPERVTPLPISFLAELRAMRALGRGVGASLSAPIPRFSPT